jgi:excisionase family DNA binding protein
MLDHALSTEELAAIWGMKPFTLRIWIRNGRLRAYKMGNEWKIDPADAAECWEKHRWGK